MGRTDGNCPRVVCNQLSATHERLCHTYKKIACQGLGRNTQALRRKPCSSRRSWITPPKQANSEAVRIPRQGKTRQVIKNQRSETTKRRSRDIAPSIFPKPVTATRHFRMSSIPHGVAQSVQAAGEREGAGGGIIEFRSPLAEPPMPCPKDPSPTAMRSPLSPAERENAVLRARRRAPRSFLPSPPGRGGTAWRWVRGLFPAFDIPQEFCSPNCQTSTASPAKPGNLTTDSALEIVL